MGLTLNQTNPTRNQRTWRPAGESNDIILTKEGLQSGSLSALQEGDKATLTLPQSSKVVPMPIPMDVGPEGWPWESRLDSIKKGLASNDDASRKRALSDLSKLLDEGPKALPDEQTIRDIATLVAKGAKEGSLQRAILTMDNLLEWARTYQGEKSESWFHPLLDTKTYPRAFVYPLFLGMHNPPKETLLSLWQTLKTPYNQADEGFAIELLLTHRNNQKDFLQNETTALLVIEKLFPLLNAGRPETRSEGKKALETIMKESPSLNVARAIALHLTKTMQAQPQHKAELLNLFYQTARRLPIEELVDVSTLGDSERLEIMDAVLRNAESGTQTARNALTLLREINNPEQRKTLWQQMSDRHLSSHLFGVISEADYDELYAELVKLKALPDVRGRQTWDAEVQAEYGRFTAVLATQMKDKPIEGDCKTMALWLMNRFCQKMKVAEPIPAGFKGTWRDESKSLINKITPEIAQKVRYDYQPEARDPKKNLVTAPNVNYIPNKGNYWVNAHNLYSAGIMQNVKERDGKETIRAWTEDGISGEKTRYYDTNLDTLKPGDVILLDHNSKDKIIQHTVNVANVRRDAQGKATALTLIVGTFDDLLDYDSATPPRYPYINYYSYVVEVPVPAKPSMMLESHDTWHSEEGKTVLLSSNNDHDWVDGFRGTGSAYLMNWKK